MNCKLGKRFKWRSDKRSNMKEKWPKTLSNKIKGFKDQ